MALDLEKYNYFCRYPHSFPDIYPKCDEKWFFSNPERIFIKEDALEARIGHCVNCYSDLISQCIYPVDETFDVIPLIDGIMQKYTSHSPFSGESGSNLFDTYIKCQDYFWYENREAAVEFMSLKAFETAKCSVRWVYRYNLYNVSIFQSRRLSQAHAHDIRISDVSSETKALWSVREKGFYRSHTLLEAIDEDDYKRSSSVSVH